MEWEHTGSAAPPRVPVNVYLLVRFFYFHLGRRDVPEDSQTMPPQQQLAQALS